MKKYPEWQAQIFDLLVDECGQIWEFDVLLFMATTLSNLQRLSLFGDPKQLPPYVTKLVNRGSEFKSLFNLFQGDTERMVPSNHRTNTDTAIVHLRTQYRMTPSLCGVHAQVFYPELKVLTHRTRGDNPEHDGLYYVPLPPERNPEVLLEKEIKLVMTLFQTIQGAGLG